MAELRPGQPVQTDTPEIEDSSSDIQGAAGKVLGLVVLVVIVRPLSSLSSSIYS